MLWLGEKWREMRLFGNFKHCEFLLRKELIYWTLTVQRSNFRISAWWFCLPPTIKQKPRRRLAKPLKKNQAKNGLSLITQRRRVQRPFGTHFLRKNSIDLTFQKFLENYYYTITSKKSLICKHFILSTFEFSR